jgi:hypothetical protein
MDRRLVSLTPKQLREAGLVRAAGEALLEKLLSVFDVQTKLREAIFLRPICIPCIVLAKMRENVERCCDQLEEDAKRKLLAAKRRSQAGRVASGF